MLKMDIYHGRKDPDEDLDECGFEGPTIKGIARIQVTYIHNFRLFFSTREALEEAVKQTGWRELDVDILEVPIRGENELIKTKDGYFGDYGIKPE